MRLFAAFAMLLTVAAFVAGCSQSRAGDSTALNGTWIPIDGELAGLPFPETVLRTLTLTVKDGKYTVDAAGKLDKGTVRNYPNDSPRGMDITGVEGPNAGKTFPAIYDLSGDTLRVCYDLGGVARPTAFRTAPGTQQFLVTYVRQRSATDDPEQRASTDEYYRISGGGMPSRW